MMRMFSYSQVVIPLCASAMLALVGCGSSGDDDTPTPAASPTPTPTPTPPPFDEWFRVTEMLIGNSDEGVDIDGDGSVDNGIEDTLIIIGDTLYTQIDETVCPDGDCEATTKQLLKQIDNIINSVFSVESLSNAINNPVQAGTLNYLLNFQEQSVGGDVDLTWNFGEFKNTGYAVTQTLGEQAGKLDGTGSGRFGPGDLSLSFSFTNPQSGSELFAFDVTLHTGYTEVTGYNGTRLTDLMTGGAILEQDLLDLVEGILVKINDLIVQGGGEELDVDVILTNISTTIEPYSDITVDGGPAFSIGLVVQADTVVVVQ